MYKIKKGTTQSYNVGVHNGNGGFKGKPVSSFSHIDDDKWNAINWNDMESKYVEEESDGDEAR